MKNNNADIVFKTKSNLDGEKIKLEWHDLLGRRIPEINWKQVHIVANYNGKLVLVYFDEIKLFHIPGGHTKLRENIETTMRRELTEETGGIILDWEPLGYQVRTDSKGNVYNQLRVYAKVTNIKEKSIDYDGNIVPIKLVNIQEMTKVLGWENPIGNHIFELVKNKFSLTNNSTIIIKNWTKRRQKTPRNHGKLLA